MSSNNNTDNKTYTLNKAQYFHEGEQAAQKQWHTETLWDEQRKQRLLWSEIPEQYHAKIEQVSFFFLATSNAQGDCDCSFKGGGPGLIKIIDSRHFAFPDFDGNGAFMSLGNILQNPHVGCLFIDFSTGERLRVNGQASIHSGDDICALFEPQPERAVQVVIEQVVPNCKAHIPHMELSS